MNLLGRRDVVVGGLSLLVANSVRAEAEPLAFTTGVLAANPFSRRFRSPPPGLVLPHTPLRDAHGKRRLSELKGKIRLVSLWAEWCAPCLGEMSDLAALNEKFSARGFEILAVLTSSKTKLGHGAATDLLRSKGASLPLWIEPDGRESVLLDLATKNGEPTLPCNLLIDTHGSIRGRTFGAALMGSSLSQQAGSTAAKPHTLTEEEKAKLLAGRYRTTWSTDNCAKFIDALLSGALES